MSELAAAIERLYAAFADEPRPRHIDICPCCVSVENVRSLLGAPLRMLTPDQLSGYAGSVFLTSGGPEDFRYFFPRILEIVIHEPYWWPTKEIIFSRLRLGEWHTWEDRQREVVIGVTREAFRNELRQASVDVGVLDAWLCGLALAHANVTPFLAMLMEKGNEETLFEYHSWNATHLGRGKLSNPFWKENRDAQRPIVLWLESEPVREIVSRIQQSRYGGI